MPDYKTSFMATWWTIIQNHKIEFLNLFGIINLAVILLYAASIRVSGEKVQIKKKLCSEHNFLFCFYF